jgi:CubicO group peptidase (beta-lactamase class C family)
MEDTGFYVPEDKHNRFAAVYTIKNDSLQEQASNGMNFKVPATLFSGGGGLVSTIDDYSKFAQMLLNGGEFDGVRILNESTVEMIMTNKLPAGVDYENGGSYGLGGSVNPEKGQYGWNGAASTHFIVDKRNNMVILVLTQLMPFNIEHALKFDRKVENAVIR